MAPEPSIGNAVQQRFARVESQMSQQGAAGIQAAGIHHPQPAASVQRQIHDQHFPTDRPPRLPGNLIDAPNLLPRNRAASVHASSHRACHHETRLMDFDRRPQRQRREGDRNNCDDNHDGDHANQSRGRRFWRPVQRDPRGPCRASKGAKRERRAPAGRSIACHRTRHSY